jgi:L-lactate dehydrogenase complex protein LldG
MTAESRQVVLERIRTGLGEIAGDAENDYARLPRLYTQRGSMTADATLGLMVERLREYDAEVVECAAAALHETIASQIAHSGRHVLVAPPGLPQAWLAKGADWRIDHALSHEQIEEAEGVVTASFCGIAESGTIALHHSATEGRRVLTLLPDWHLCVLHASHVVETLPEYFARCPAPPQLATYISGPSATADIEMTRIKGVHGPRFLSVVMVRDDLFSKELNT